MPRRLRGWPPHWVGQGWSAIAIDDAPAWPLVGGVRHPQPPSRSLSMMRSEAARGCDPTRSHCHRVTRPGCSSTEGWVLGLCQPGCHRRAPTQWWRSQADVSDAVREASQAAAVSEVNAVEVDEAYDGHSGVTALRL